ncbi:hypothetical protein, partial [Streptomyces zaomyceticus]|uniref:hypothetical protein n=1 Tax=Streptomyces zaomyceticus TaxID=68286 RepID=UPI003694024C
ARGFARRPPPAARRPPPAGPAGPTPGARQPGGPAGPTPDDRWPDPRLQVAPPGVPLPSTFQVNPPIRSAVDAE